jgi:hypothetical protein
MFICVLQIINFTQKLQKLMYFDGQRHGLVNLGEILPDSRFFLLRTRDNARHRRSIRYNRAIPTSVSDPDSLSPDPDPAF